MRDTPVEFLMVRVPKSVRLAAGLAIAGAYSTCKVHDWPAGTVAPLQVSAECWFMKLALTATLPRETLAALELVKVTGVPVLVAP